MTGKSFTNYFIEFSFEIAAEMLKTSDEKISTIAEKCGFNNFSYFTRKFFEKYDCNPSTYKKRSRSL